MLLIKYLTIHCAATPEGRDVSPDTVAQWDIARFGQESYHWIVDLSGNAHRRLSDKTKGAHVAGANTGNIGVCYIGGVDSKNKPKDTRMKAQVETLRKIVEQYKRDYPGIIVRGHRDWPKVAKACPSFDVATEL